MDDFTDLEALVAIVRINGINLRFIRCLLMQIERILRINELRPVIKEVVEGMRAMFVIGQV